MEKSASDKKKYSQLTAMLALSKASFISITRSPSAVIFTLFFPLIFIVVFGFIGGGGFSLDVATGPNLKSAVPIYEALRHIPPVKLHENEPEKQVDEALGKGTYDAYIDATQDVKEGRPHFNVLVKTSAASKEKADVFKMMITDVVNRINMSQTNAPPPMIDIKQEVVSGRPYKTIDFILPGQLGFALLSTGVFGTAFVFLSLRQTLVIKRFFATPVKRLYIVLAEALARLVFALIGAVVIILIGRYAFGFTLIHGAATLLNMLILSTIGVIVFMGFGFVVSGIARNESSVPPLANIITLPQFLLSGTFFSIDVFPSWLQPISRALPLTYLNDAFRQVAFEGAGIFDVSRQIFILLLWGIAVYIAAAKLFRWE